MMKHGITHSYLQWCTYSVLRLCKPLNERGCKSLTLFPEIYLYGIYAYKHYTMPNEYITLSRGESYCNYSRVLT